MKKIALTTVILLSAFGSIMAQQIQDYALSRVNWSTWDKYPQNSKAKESFLAPLKVDGQPLEIDSLLYFKVVDVDGLNDLDVIKAVGPDSTGIIVYINTFGNLKEVYRAEENIIQITKVTPISAISFQTAVTDDAKGTFEIKHLEAIVEPGVLRYQNLRTEIVHKGSKDIYRNMPPSYFTIKNHGTPLVEGPGLDYLIRTCSAKEVGYAMGSFKTKSGDVWWKVYMLEQDYSFTMGWLKRSDVLTGYQK